MQYLGFLLIALAVVGLVIGVLQRAKMKKILAAPFKKTGEVAQNPQAGDAKGTISTEGAIQVQQPLVAPCSGKPCVYYEIKVERMWEKQVNTENGVKTEKGTSTVSTTEQGSQFYVNDGSGPVGVDAREKVDTELTKSFEQAQNVSYGDLTFGQYHVHVPYHGGDERTTGIRATEKILPSDGNVFVMGKLAAGVITKQDGMLGKVLISTKGRDKLVGHTKRNMILGFVAGGVLFAGGVPTAIFGDPPKDYCANLVDAMKENTCSDRMHDDNGKTYDWKVTKAGPYKLTVSPTGTSAGHRLWPKMQVTKGGETVFEEAAPAGGNLKLTGWFDKGTYKVKIGEQSPGWIKTLKGGAGFTFDIKEVGGTEGELITKMHKGLDDLDKKLKGEDKGDDDKKADSDINCGDTVEGLKITDEKEVTCPSGCTSGTIYGTKVYTTDSPICVAAVHAGVIKSDKGGKVTVKVKSGQGSYSGSKANGVTSSKWGKYEKSFSVE